MKFNKSSKNKFFLISLIFVLVYLNFAVIFKQYSDVWWDSAAYIGVGKYIFSYGEEGVFEPMRAPLLPLILGIFWKLGFNVIYAGKIFIFLTAVFSLFFLYSISKELFDENVAAVSCVILFFNVLFLIFVFRIYTEMLSICLILASVFFMLKFSSKGKYHSLFLSALFSVLAFLAKYPNVLIFGVLNIFLIYKTFKTKKIKPLLFFNIFFFVLVSPFFISNYLLFKDPLYLMKISQNYYKENLGKLYSLKIFPSSPKFIFRTSFIYFYSILLFFNILTPFMLFGIYKTFKRGERNFIKKLLLLFIALTFFCFFEIFYLKEERYLLPIYPFLALFSAYGLLKLKRRTAFLIIFIYIILSIFSLALFFRGYDEKAYQSFFINPPINFSCGRAATSDPRSVINYKVDFPYEVFDEYWTETNIIKKNPDCIFYFSCYKNREEHIKKLNKLNYSLEYPRDTGSCLYAILKKAPMKPL